MTASFDLNRPAVDPAVWPLDPATTFLNHGSFGSCPRAVLDFQSALRDRMERQPVQFFVRDLEAMLDAARGALATFVGAESRDLAFVSNATAGVNTVLRSLHFEAGAELLVTDHEYNACRNALDFAAERQGALVVVVRVPFPVRSPQEVTAAILDESTRGRDWSLRTTSRAKQAWSCPSSVGESPVGTRRRPACRWRHAPGMLPLDLRAIGAAYYTGNCHNGSAPLKAPGFSSSGRSPGGNSTAAISHGANLPRTDRSKFLIEFGWTGTWDPTPPSRHPRPYALWERYCPATGQLSWLGTDPSRWLAVTRSAAVSGRTAVSRRDDRRAGSYSAGRRVGACDGAFSALYRPAPGRVARAIRDRGSGHSMAAPPKRILRISAQLYNSLPEYERLGDALVALGSGGAI